MFERLGRLAILDLFFGNLDRLVQVNLRRDNTYALDNMLEVNLGNVMVGRDDQPTLYSIDNGVDQALIDDPEKRQKYLDFLRGLFSQKDPFLDLTTNFVDCFRNALRSQIDDVEYVPTEDKSGSSGGGASKSQKADLSLLRKQMEPILADLQHVAIKEAVDKGMKKMSRWMANVVPSIWRENSGALRLQEYLSTHYPIYLEAINERLSEFQKLNPGPKEM